MKWSRNRKIPKIVIWGNENVPFSRYRKSDITIEFCDIELVEKRVSLVSNKFILADFFIF